MSLRSIGVTAVEILIVVTVVSLVAGSLLGQPVLLSYVETESMEPTIDAGDGFVAVPSPLTGEPAAGDVVVYRAEELHGGGLTTHRIVGQTDDGYVTKGDANPFTDQDGDEPPVSDDQIVAHALQLGDTVVVIPHLGTVVGGIQQAVETVASMIASVPVVGAIVRGHGPGTLLVGLGTLLFVATLFLDEGRPPRPTERTRRRESLVDTRIATALLLAAILIPANAAMVLPDDVKELEVTGEDVAASDGFVPGETATWDVAIDNHGLVPVVVVFAADADDQTLHEEQVIIWPGEVESLSVAAEAPERGERTVIDVSDSRYLLVMPPAVLISLHEIHPALALLAVNVVLGGAVVLAVRFFVGIGVFRVRSHADISLGTRLRRRFW